MWDSIATVLTSTNGVQILCTLMFLIALVGMFAKLGIFSLKKGGVNIGKNNLLEERLLLKRELEFVQKYCLSLEGEIAYIFEDLKHDKMDRHVYRFKYLASIISNEMERWVLINHFSKDPSYLRGKAIELRALLVSEVGKMGMCEYDDNLLTQSVDKWVATVVEQVLLLKKGNALIG